MIPCRLLLRPIVTWRNFLDHVSVNLFILCLLRFASPMGHYTRANSTLFVSHLLHQNLQPNISVAVRSGATIGLWHLVHTIVSIENNSIGYQPKVSISVPDPIHSRFHHRECNEKGQYHYFLNHIRGHFRQTYWFWYSVHVKGEFCSAGHLLLFICLFVSILQEVSFGLTASAASTICSTLIRPVRASPPIDLQFFSLNTLIFNALRVKQHALTIARWWSWMNQWNALPSWTTGAVLTFEDQPQFVV